MTRITTTALLTFSLALAALCSSALAQQGAPPYTTNNAQSACVEYGSCSTAGGDGVLTATQKSPVTAPAGTPALATYTTLDSSFISSLAAAGASAAYSGGSASKAAAVTSTSTVFGSSNSGSSGSGSGSGSGGSGSSRSSGSSGSTATGLGSLGSSNGGSVVGLGGAAMQLVALGSAAVLGAAVLL